MGPDPKQYHMEPIDLTPEQDDRIVRAIAIHEAKLAALKAGMTLEQVQEQTWVVEVHPSEDHTSQ